MQIYYEGVIMAVPEKILNEVLNLPSVVRAELVDEILLSFKANTDKEIDKLWAGEVESRRKALKSGEMTSRPADEMFKDYHENKGLFSR